jgi:hypothetical protein
MDVKRREREFSLFIIVLFYIESAITVAGIERDVWLQPCKQTYALHVCLPLKRAPPKKEVQQHEIYTVHYSASL